MITNFQQLIEAVKNRPLKTIAVAAAQDEDVLRSLAEAKAMGIADAILVGDQTKILKLWNSLDKGDCPFEIFDIKDNVQAAEFAVQLIQQGKADLIMKGILTSSEILKAVLNKEKGLRKADILSHVTVLEAPKKDRLICMTDPAMIIAPTLSQKVSLLYNAAEVARSFGIEMPKAAVVAAIEMVNPDMPATIDAALLAQMCKRGQIKGIEVDGPFALDNAVSLASAKLKGINSEVAGRADILLVPDVEAGNILYKALAYFSDTSMGGIVVGARVPVILASRADSASTKLNSIALACFMEKEKANE